MGTDTDPEYLDKQEHYQSRKRAKLVEVIQHHFIRPCYLHESDAPLKFYKLIRVVLPIGAILNFLRAIQATTVISTANEAAKPYSIIDAVYMWVGLVLLLGAAAGLNRMEWAGVRFYSALFGWQIVYNAFLAILGAHWQLYDFEYFGRPIMEVIFLSVWLYFCMIYFGKRRLLFSPGGFNDPPERANTPVGEPASHDQVVSNYPEPSPIEPEPLAEQEPPTALKPPAIIPKKQSKKPAPRAITLILAVALTLSLAGNIWQAAEWSSERKTLTSEIKEKEQSISNMEIAYSSLKSEVYDLQEYHFDTYYSTGYIVNGSNYFHRYDCPVVEAADTYQSHNTEFCKRLGYGGCPVCNSGSSISKIGKTPKQSAP